MKHTLSGCKSLYSAYTSYEDRGWKKSRRSIVGGNDSQMLLANEQSRNTCIKVWDKWLKMIDLVGIRWWAHFHRNSLILGGNSSVQIQFQDARISPWSLFLSSRRKRYADFSEQMPDRLFQVRISVDKWAEFKGNGCAKIHYNKMYF